MKISGIIKSLPPRLSFAIVRNFIGSFIFLLFSLSWAPAFSIGLKVIKDYPFSLLSNSMPWQMDIKDDWIFAATEDGLIQFDGTYPELFPFNNRRPLRSVNVSPEEGRIYAGGINEFGYFLPSTKSSLSYVCLSDSVEDARHIGNIWGIYPHDGIITLQGDATILIYDTNTGKHESVPSPHKLDCSAWIDKVLWLGTDNGLKFLMGNSIVEATGTEALKGERIRAILKKENLLLIITAKGVWTYDKNNLSLMIGLNDELDKLGEIFSADIRGDLLALGSIDNGVGIVDLSTGEMKIYNEKHGLPSNTVLSVKFGSDGDLWTGLQFGMSKILLNLPVERLDNSSLPIGSGYAMAVADNMVYLGTNRGLFSVPYIPSKDLSKSSVKAIEGMRGQVWGLTKIDDDLFCCHDRGLFIVKDGRIEQIGDMKGIWDVQKQLASTDRAYVGSYFGLQTIRKVKGKWIAEKPIEGYSGSTYNFVQETPDIIWTDDGEEGVNRLIIDTVNNKIKEIKNFKETADGFPLTADVYLSRIDNDIYISTFNGIYVYNKSKGEIVKDKEISRLLGNPRIVKRLKKTNGSIYALTSNEILQADPAGILDLKRISLEPTRAKPMHDKDVFFPMGGDFIGYPTRNGYLFFDFSNRDKTTFAGTKPKVRINNIHVTSEGDSLIYRGNFGNIKTEPTLKYGENSIRIEYGSPDQLEKGIVYSTRLNDEPWSNPVPSISKEYTQLREGKYKFEVKALSPGGSEATDSFSFIVLPPWWRSQWMILFYVVFIIFMIGFALWFEQRRVRRQQSKALKEKDKEMVRRQQEYQRESEEKDRHIMKLEKEKLDKELRHKAQEVANVMMNLSHKNETLQTVKRELQNILPMLPKTSGDARKAIMELQGKVTVDIRSDEVLKRVEEEFDIANDNFMKRLRSRYPELNNNEVLLCAYIKMNLSTKEIAPLLNISVRGVETMRYRLRKKMNLEREDNLTEFLSR